MRDHPWERIFISYSRKDGAECAAKLRKELERENLSVWQDIITLEGDQDWWSQIEYALRSRDLQHFVLVVTPAALKSRVVRQEISLARQEGKTVCPVKGPGLGELRSLPRWLGQIYLRIWAGPLAACPARSRRSTRVWRCTSKAVAASQPHGRVVGPGQDERLILRQRRATS